MQRVKAAGFRMRSFRTCSWTVELVLPDEAAMRAAGLTTTADSSDHFLRDPRTRDAPAGCRCTGIWATSRSATTCAGPQRTRKRIARRCRPGRAVHRATSFIGDKSDDPHFRLARALHVANLNLHDERAWSASRAGAGWGFTMAAIAGPLARTCTSCQGIRPEVPLELALERRRGRPYYALDCRETTTRGATPMPTAN